MSDSKAINLLKERKVLKEVDLLKFREQSNTLSKRIAETRARLSETRIAYKKAGDNGLTDRQRELSEAMQNMQAVLGSLAKQKKSIDHWALEYNEELVKLNTEIAHQESANTNPYFSSQKQRVSETTEDEETVAEAPTTVPTTPSTTPQKLTPKSIKKQLQANLASGQPKKNIKLIRQGMGQKSKPQPTTPPPPLSTPSAQASSIQKPPVWKRVLSFGKQQAKNAAYDAYDTATRPVVRTAKTVTRPYYVTKNAVETTSAIISATKEHGSKKVIAFGAREAGSAAKNRALSGVTTILSPAINLANNIKNTVKTLKNIVKAVRILTTSATLVGAVANLALLLKDKLKKLLILAAKIYAAVQALLMLMWLWVLAKIAGLVAGMVFGAVSGLPLLLVPGVGPFLYAGWVGFWTYKGWTDPLGTIHLATHPWEAITRPLNWIGDQFSGFGAGAKGGVDAVAGGVGNATSGAIGAAGNFVTGLASSAWGGFTAGVGSLAGSVGSFAGGFFSSLASAGSAIVGNVIPVAVGGTMATVVGGTVMGTIITNSAFYTQELDTQEEIFTPGEGQDPGETDLFTITKNASPTQINKPQDILDSETATFTVTITAKANITITDFSDITSPVSDSGFSRNNGCSSLPITTLSAGQTTGCTEIITINSTQPEGTTITNRATLTASDGTTPATGSATATVRIGTIPTGGDCNFEFVTGNIAWTQAEIDTVNAICTTLLGPVRGLLDNAGTITLQRFGGDCAGFVDGGTVVSITGCNLTSIASAQYVVVHELGHVIGNRNDTLYQNYVNSGAYQSEGMIRTYPICPGSINEGFAEMIADYVVAKTYYFPARCTGHPEGFYTTFQTDYPRHYNFARDNIFGGVEY